MRDRLATVALVALTLTGLQAALPAAQAHPGNGCGFDLIRLEAECYGSPIGCDPDEQGEHVHAEPFPLASDGFTAYLPRSGCGIAFATVTLPFDGALAGFGVRCSGTAVGMTVRLNVNLDFARYGSTTFACNAPSSVLHVPWPDARPLSAGAHRQMEVWTETLDGPVYANVELDYFDLLPRVA